MFAQRALYSLAATVSLLLVPGGSQAQNAALPPAVQALEDQGVIIHEEFDAGTGLRGFAGAVDDRPIAVYVLDDGNAIVGTRVNAKGEPVDEATLQKLVAKPISDQTWAQLESSKWVLDGKADAPRIIYTFTDANCPYCHRFWEAARPWVDAGKVQLRHIMVGIIKQDSPAKAASILDAPDPSAALKENEIKYDTGGIKPAARMSEQTQTALEDNQLLMMSMGFRGTPGIAFLGKDGLIEKFSGMPRPEALAELLGPR